ncbi:transmembrane protein [Anaeramoeba flamelloides]|uniref:Transmembrane protein n=1 Tax=Anaeramoeba flamelloides TaxID=1746091 RepID=A0ABQ8YRK2_9EUKA|nr:transmembrane protein [Anaeramoeba flamelloides]
MNKKATIIISVFVFCAVALTLCLVFLLPRTPTSETKDIKLSDESISTFEQRLEFKISAVEEIDNTNWFEIELTEIDLHIYHGSNQLGIVEFTDDVLTLEKRKKKGFNLYGDISYSGEGWQDILVDYTKDFKVTVTIKGTVLAEIAVGSKTIEIEKEVEVSPTSI